MLEFLIESHGDQCHLTQIARFQPRGLLGILYWYAVMPLHGIVFRDMLLGIRRVAEGERDFERDNEQNRTSTPAETSPLA